VVSPGQPMQDFLLDAGVRHGDVPRTPEEVIALSQPYGFEWTDVLPGPRG